MRLSSFWLSTQKETPAEAEVVSHQLMLRAGMIRQTAVGVYSWLPLGLRVLKKVEAIVREEMNRAGALEVFMPMVQPNELWRESKRWQDYGPELLRFLDRHEREYCLGPTHEEVVTDLMRRDLTSYKQLPLNVYQIQTKFRDEIRPRFGVMRGREFLMKDGYSFHLDEACLQQTYEAMYQAYCRIFERIGLDYRAVLADNGSIGGTGSHEFHVLAQTGEDDIVFSQDGSYAANMEKAQAYVAPVECADAGVEKVKFATPECGSIEQLCAQYDVDAMQSVKTLLVKGAQEGQLVALVLRGGDSLNEVKAEHLDVVASPLVFADEAEVRAVVGAGFGSLGPFELGLPLVVDYEAARLADFVAGANEDGFHYKHLNMARDVPEAMVADIRNVMEGDLSPQTRSPLLIKRGIEVGHIFQLGVKYSQSMGLKVPLEDGGSTTPLMGCYGIGVSRIVAAAIEQNHDARGIIFPQAIAPFSVAILPLNAHKSAEVAEAAEKLYAQLLDCGVEVALDDRGKRAGVMFADMDLIGVPMRVVISDKTLAQGAVEFKLRREEEAQLVALSEVVAQIKALI